MAITKQPMYAAGQPVGGGNDSLCASLEVCDSLSWSKT